MKSSPSSQGLVTQTIDLTGILALLLWGRPQEITEVEVVVGDLLLEVPHLSEPSKSSILPPQKPSTWPPMLSRVSSYSVLVW